MSDAVSNRGSRLRRVRLVAWLVIIPVILVCIFLPEVVSLVWRMAHGSSAKFQQWEVPVPWGWRALKGDGMLVLQRIHRLYYREDAFSEVIIGNLPPFSNDSDDYYEKEKKELQARLGKEGYRLTGERRVRLEGQPGYCISFGAIQNLNRLWISCEFPNQQLWVGFIGDQTYAPMLDSIVKHVKPRQ